MGFIGMVLVGSLIGCSLKSPPLVLASKDSGSSQMLAVGQQLIGSVDSLSKIASQCSTSLTGDEMGESTSMARSGDHGALVTAAIWVVGVALQFATPLLRDRVPLSDVLFVGSFLAPWWCFAQVVLLAGFLALFRKAAIGWSHRGRIAFAVASAGLFSLLQSELITLVIEDGVPLADDPVRVALLWSTPLAFYLVPATLVVYSWLKRDARLTLIRALGIGLVVIGVLSFPYILWLTRLWELHIEPQGGGSASAPGGVWC